MATTSLQLATTIKFGEMTSNAEEDHRPASDWGHSEDTQGKRRKYRHWGPQDALRWASAFQLGTPIILIAAADEVYPKLVSLWLHRLGVQIYQGQRPHRPQPPLQIPTRLLELVKEGHSKILDLVQQRVWGIDETEIGVQQLRNFCQFVILHGKGVGVKEVAKTLGIHRSTILKWRQGINTPYLAKVANSVYERSLSPEWKFLPLRIGSGGNEQKDWIRVPTSIHRYNQILTVIHQTIPLESTYERAAEYRISEQRSQRMRPELFSYLLGMMLGDSGKLGGQQQRFSSMNIDLQLTRKKPTNQTLGEFVCMCANSLGIAMDQKKDKQPTGVQRFGKSPTPAYRWSSERSPLLAWMFSVGLGLRWDETTTTNKVRMDWIFQTPYNFRKRFVQALADSDGTVKGYGVIITSVPNADLVTRLLSSLGMTTAHTIYEYGIPLRTRVRTKQAAKLPVFNEFTKSYRYQKLQQYA